MHLLHHIHIKKKSFSFLLLSNMIFKCWKILASQNKNMYSIQLTKMPLFFFFPVSAIHIFIIHVREKLTRIAVTVDWVFINFFFLPNKFKI